MDPGGKRQDERAQLHKLIIERNGSIAAVLTAAAAGAHPICHGQTGASTTPRSILPLR